MKVLCDVHIARKVVRFFQGEGVEAIHINDILESQEGSIWVTTINGLNRYDAEANDFEVSHRFSEGVHEVAVVF